MKETNNKPQRCLDDKELGTLAIRMSVGDGARSVPAKGPLDNMPEDLFASAPVEYRDHLRECESCRFKLAGEIRYLINYRRIASETDLSGEFESLEGFGDPRSSGQYQPRGKQTSPESGEFIVLKRVFIDDDEEDQHVLAASTTPTYRELLKFTAKDRDLLLKEIPSQQNDTIQFAIMGKSSEYLSNITLIIEGKEYRQDNLGVISIPKAHHNFPNIKKLILKKR